MILEAIAISKKSDCGCWIWVGGVKMKKVGQCLVKYAKLIRLGMGWVWWARDKGKASQSGGLSRMQLCYGTGLQGWPIHPVLNSGHMSLIHVWTQNRHFRIKLPEIPCDKSICTKCPDGFQPSSHHCMWWNSQIHIYEHGQWGNGSFWRSYLFWPTTSKWLVFRSPSSFSIQYFPNNWTHLFCLLTCHGLNCAPHKKIHTLKV